MRNKKRAYNILVFLILGAAIGLFIKYVKQLTFDFEVSVFDVFALAITAALAWWVAEKLEKDSDKERCEKDIIIEKLRSIDSLIVKLNDMIEENDIVSLTSVTSIIGSIDAHSTRVVEQISSHYPKVLQDNKEADYSRELDSLDELCTDDTDCGMVSSIDKGISVCIYTPERKEDICTCSNLLSDKIFNLEILVNRA